MQIPRFVKHEQSTKYKLPELDKNKQINLDVIYPGLPRNRKYYDVLGEFPKNVKQFFKNCFQLFEYSAANFWARKLSKCMRRLTWEHIFESLSVDRQELVQN